MSEQSTQIKAQKREDMLMDMYKLHAYIPNDAEGNPLTPFGNFCSGYEAATAEANKCIAALESEVAKQTEIIWNNEHEISILKLVIEQKDLDNESLKANNHYLREALGNARILADEILNGQQASDVLAMRIMSVADTALAATPAESLAKHDDEVIEKVIFVINQYYDINHIRDDVIRELKGK